MPAEWTPEVQAAVLDRMAAMHDAMAGDRSRGQAWAAALGVRPSDEFDAFLSGVLGMACQEGLTSTEDGDDRIIGAVAGLNHGIGLAAAVAHALAEDDLT